jgi:hypothetical protein
MFGGWEMFAGWKMWRATSVGAAPNLCACTWGSLHLCVCVCVLCGWGVGGAGLPRRMRELSWAMMHVKCCGPSCMCSTSGV